MTVVHANFPVAVAFALRKGGKPRSAVVDGTVAVEVAHVDPRDVRALHDDPRGPLRYVIHEGGLWHVPMMRPGEPLPAGTAFRWMEEPVEPGYSLATRTVEAHLARTPLLWTFREGRRRAHVRRGEEHVPERCVRIGDDEADAARAVTDFIERDVRVCGDGLLVRAVGPLVAIRGGYGTHAHLDLLHDEGDLDADRVATGHHRAADLWRWAGGEYNPYPCPMPETPAWLRALRRVPPGPREAETLAALSVASVRGSLHLHRNVRDPAARGVVRSLAQRLEPSSFLAATGMLRGEAMVDALGLCVEALEGMTGRGGTDLRDRDGDNTYFEEGALLLLDAIRHDQIPRALESVKPVPEDDAALSGLRL